MREDGVAGGGVQGFPRVERLDDVLPAIKGRPEFAVSRRRGYVAVDYLYQTPDSFLAGAGAGEAQRRAAALRRECRGIKFDAITGEIVARPYAKFFNLGENEETRPESVDWSRPHRVLDKLDGSMVVPAEVEGGLRWMTRVSDAGVSTAAHAFAAARAPLMGLACEAIGAGWSPIFEWCGPSQRIVIEYPRDRMVLTGARHMRGGDVLPYPDLVDLAGRWGVPVVEELGEGRSGRALVEHVRALEDLEGCVVRFEDGAMIKLKADAYVARHRAVSDLASEKKVLRLVLEGLEDDVLPLLSAVDRAALLPGAEKKARPGERALFGVMGHLGQLDAVAFPALELAPQRGTPAVQGQGVAQVHPAFGHPLDDPFVHAGGQPAHARGTVFHRDGQQGLSVARSGGDHQGFVVPEQAPLDHRLDHDDPSPSQPIPDSILAG